MAEADISLDNMIHLDLGYDTQHPKRGHAFIFNNESFTNMKNRAGSSKDRDNLSDTFTKLGFEVTVRNDLTAQNINTALHEVSRYDHRDFDCFLCVFLTHGDEGIIYGSDGDPESFNGNGNVDSTNRTWLWLKEDVFDIFRGNRTLKGKPKIFIIQACRGGNAERPVKSFDRFGAPGKYFEAAEGVRVTIPTEADFLICYSSSEGYFSVRESDKGTWFIQDLTRVLKELGNNADFIQLLTVVNRLVSERTVEGSGELAGIKQMPCFLSKLTKQLRLDDKTASPETEKRGCCNRCRCC